MTGYIKSHEASRAEQFDDPVFVFDDPKIMRVDLEYGIRINRRLHSLPFGDLQNVV